MYEEYCDPNIPVGDSTRHGFCPLCNDTVARQGFIVIRTWDGWVLYCHKCNKRKFVKQSGLASPSTLLSRINAPRIDFSKIPKAVYLPDDFTQEMPNSAKRWLYKYGVTKEEIKKYRIGYCPWMDRVILPVFKEGQLIFWQARKLNPEDSGPKYLSVTASRTTTWFEAITPGSEQVVLVEDILSALAVRRAGFSSLAMLGTNLSSKLMKKLQDIGVKRVCIWLDSDKRKESTKYAKKLNSLGFRAWACVLPDKDPKDHCGQDIEKILLSGGFQNEKIPSSGAEKKTSDVFRHEAVQDRV